MEALGDAYIDVIVGAAAYVPEAPYPYVGAAIIEVIAGCWRIDMAAR